MTQIRAALHEAAAPTLKGFAERARSRHLFALDLVGSLIAALVALILYLDVSRSPAAPLDYLWLVGLVVATRMAVGLLVGLYRHSWRHASVGDMGLLVTCAAAGTAPAWGTVLLLEQTPAPLAPMPSLAFWVTELFLAFVVMAGPRFGIRAASDLRVRAHGRHLEAKPTLLYGAGWAGVILARSATRGEATGVVPVGFLDDDPDLAGTRVAGLRVFGGLDALSRAVRATGAASVVIAIPSASGDAIRRIVEGATDLGIAVHTVPPMTDLLDGSLDTTRIRKVRVEDLLRRPLAKEHTPAARDVFAGRTVVVTGAAGSIGSELARQVLALDPAHVVLVDQAESPLFFIERELVDRVAERKTHEGTTAPMISAHLTDIKDMAGMRALFEQVRPDIVLHAAAYKHVPLLEDHPAKAVETNVGGTLATLEAAEAVGVERFVLVSTDKAVRPSSVMGASKRIAEMVVADSARRLGRPYISVRFGNVLGSNGSVIPIFQRQLEKGQPLTVTDPNMTRYFMTIPEASWLILDAAAIAEEGGLFVLDMGEPVRIIDIARDLIRLSGRDQDSVPIRFVGLRKGEKMHEQLFYDEEAVRPTAVDKVMRADSQAPPHHIRQDVRGILSLARGAEPSELSRTLHTYVRASMRLDDGLWGSFETGELTSEKLGTRPVVVVPVHGDGQAVGLGRQRAGLAAEKVSAGAGRRGASVSADPHGGIAPLAYFGATPDDQTEDGSGPSDS